MSKKGEPKSDSTIVNELRNNDILMGRGKRSNGRVGNFRLRQLAEAKAFQYKQLRTKKDKRIFARQFIADIESTGARFLQPISVPHEGSFKTAYTLVPRQAVEVKVKQLLRDRAALLQKEVGFPSDRPDVARQGDSLKETKNSNDIPRRLSLNAQRSQGTSLLAPSLYATLPFSQPSGLSPSVGLTRPPDQLALAEQLQQIQRLLELQAANVNNPLRVFGAGSTQAAASQGRRPSQENQATLPADAARSGSSSLQGPPPPLLQAQGLGLDPSVLEQLARLERVRLLQQLQEQQVAAAALLRGQPQFNPMELLLAQEQLRSHMAGRRQGSVEGIPAGISQLRPLRNPEVERHANEEHTASRHMDNSTRNQRKPPPGQRGQLS